MQNKRHPTKRRQIESAVLIGLLVLVYVMIFSFSADDGDASSVVSLAVTKWILHIYYKITSSSTAVVVIPDANYMDEAEAVIRKMAHFSEYMLLGVLAVCLYLLWVEAARTCALFTIAQLIVSASLDEFHQYFVPGRYASVKDVAIDTAGGAFGMLLVLLIHLLRQRRRLQKPSGYNESEELNS